MRLGLLWAVIAPLAAAAAGAPRAASCTITDHGAVAGNRTADAPSNTLAITKAVASCQRVDVPAGAFKFAPFTLPSDTELYLREGASLVATDDPEHYKYAHFMPPMGKSGTTPGQLQLEPLITNARGSQNVTIAGANGTIDGNGWFAWPSANWQTCALKNDCLPPRYFGPSQAFPPHIVTFTHCVGCSMRNVTITNPPFWGLQHFFCNDTLLSGVTILAPRWTRQIGGYMPFAVRNYTVEDSFVAVGDDAVAIMSGPDFVDPNGCPADRPCPVNPTNLSVGTRGVVFRRMFVLGRDIAIGSEDFGSVSDVLIEDSTIGDNEGSCPWAFKIKMHSNVAANVSNVLIRNVKLGNITSNPWQDPGGAGGTALHMSMSYNDPPVDPSLPQPRMFNITFQNVTATATRVAGQFAGAFHPIQGLHFRDCDFRTSARDGWQLKNVDLSSCTAENTQPSWPGGR